MRQLNIEEKSKVTYCISTDLRDEQIKINIEKVKGRLQQSEIEIEEPIALVSFGPSLNETWEELKKFKYIMTCSGAHKFLIDKGIIPTYHVELEPREHKIQMLGNPHKDVEYLIASTIHPKYLDALEGFNVKLWHIFATEEDGARVLPRGELLVTGGSSVGLRCMTLARILGFKEFHIFGMDGSIRENATHTTYHPNAPKEKFETEYDGKKYFTTPSMLHVAKETWSELDQLSDCKAFFYGEGLIQHMAKNYVPSPKKGGFIAFNKPELISKEHTYLNSKLHKDNPKYGMGGAKHADTVIKLSEQLKTTSILDYGAGKMMLAKSLPFPIWSYDPAVPEISQAPKPADIVVCTDVLEHIEPDKLNFVLDDIRRCTKKIGYLVISTRKAVKTYENGQNTHLIVQGKDWWNKVLGKFFDIGTIIEKEKEAELHVVISPKVPKVAEHVTMEKDGKQFKYFTPNETTKWRANSLFKKEPSTIEWLDTIKPGEVLWDVGANIGSYSVYAGVKGVKVYAFEPEAENFALLTKNLIFNGLEPNAYNIALSDKQNIGTLYLGQAEAGGACHSFGAEVGHDLQSRPSVSKQGCIAMTIDQLVEMGLPRPDHLKIDVDGFEMNVIKGAAKTLPLLKSFIVEINPNVHQHMDILTYVDDCGFSYDPEQVKRAERKEGTFKGVAEYVFTKKKQNAVSVVYTGKDHRPPVGYTVSSLEKAFNDSALALLNLDVLKHPSKRVEDAAMELEPYNYLYVEDIIPKHEYDNLLKYIEGAKYTEIEKSRGTKGYPLRYTADAPDFIKKTFLDGSFKKALLKKFGIEDRNFVEDLLLVRDLPGYSIPPHTDSLRKVITVLIYLPEVELPNAGTSMYVPKEKGFTCDIGVHHPFEKFDKVKTMSFKSNAAFVFARTSESFHGVEPSKQVRDVLLYNINRK